MSWAAHNPEKYDELMLEGVMDFISGRIPELSADELEDFKWLLDQWIFEGTEEGARIQHALIWVARRETECALGNYFTGGH